jgi:hypothetical protein
MAGRSRTIEVNVNGMRVVLVLALTGASLAAISAHAQATADETVPRVVNLRAHWSVRDGGDSPTYVVTKIMRSDLKSNTSIVLIEDQQTHERFVYRSTFDPRAATSEISDVSGKRYIRRTLEMNLPTTATTVPGIIREAGENPGVFALTDPLLRFETASFSYELRGSEFQHQKRGAVWVSQLRETLDPHFLESLERMRDGGFLSSRAGNLIYLDFGPMLFHGECTLAETARDVEEQPDCAFDKRFGFACDDAQLAKIEAARKDGRRLIAY